MFSCAGDVTIEPSPHGYLAGIDCLGLGSVFVGKPLRVILRPSNSKPHAKALNSKACMQATPENQPAAC